MTLLVYWTTLLLTLVTSKVDDKLSLYQHNNSLWEDMEPSQLSHQLETWKVKFWRHHACHLIIVKHT